MRREKASASPPSTMLLTDLPPNSRAMNVAQRGKRDREEDRDRGPHAAEKDQNHHARSGSSPMAAFVQQRFDGCLARNATDRRRRCVIIS